MGRKLIDISGQKFKMLTAIELDHMQGHRAYWKFKCDCGKVVVARADAVKFGKIDSCGCLGKFITENGLRGYIHGKSRSLIYDRWQGMMDRCYRNKNNSFANYGARGIKVCEEWHDFERYYEWAIANGYSDDLTIDRIDVNGNYEPSNCRFITVKEQQRNKRTNVVLTINGETKCVTEWCEEFNFPRHVVYRRLRNNPNITIEELFKPPKKYKYKRKNQ